MCILYIQIKAYFFIIALHGTGRASFFDRRCDQQNTIVKESNH